MFISSCSFYTRFTPGTTTPYYFLTPLTFPHLASSTLLLSAWPCRLSENKLICGNFANIRSQCFTSNLEMKSVPCWSCKSHLYWDPRFSFGCRYRYRSDHPAWQTTKDLRWWKNGKTPLCFKIVFTSGRLFFKTFKKTQKPHRFEILYFQNLINIRSRCLPQVVQWPGWGTPTCPKKENHQI